MKKSFLIVFIMLLGLGVVAQPPSISNNSSCDFVIEGYCVAPGDCALLPGFTTPLTPVYTSTIPAYHSTLLPTGLCTAPDDFVYRLKAGGLLSGGDCDWIGWFGTGPCVTTFNFFQQSSCDCYNNGLHIITYPDGSLAISYP